MRESAVNARESSSEQQKAEPHSQLRFEGGCVPGPAGVAGIRHRALPRAAGPPWSGPRGRVPRTASSRSPFTRRPAAEWGACVPLLPLFPSLPLFPVDVWTLSPVHPGHHSSAICCCVGGDSSGHRGDTMRGPTTALWAWGDQPLPPTL